MTVLSHGLWQRRFGGDAKILGSVIQVDGVPRRIVGVLAEGFHFPSVKEEMWTPMVIDPANLQPGNFNYGGVGRLRPGVTTERATKELSALVWRLPEALGPDVIPRSMIEQAKLGVLAKPFRDHLVGDIGRTLWVLLGDVGLIFLIACANVATCSWSAPRGGSGRWRCAPRSARSGWTPPWSASTSSWRS